MSKELLGEKLRFNETKISSGLQISSSDVHITTRFEEAFKYDVFSWEQKRKIKVCKLSLLIHIDIQRSYYDTKIFFTLIQVTCSHFVKQDKWNHLMDHQTPKQMQRNGNQSLFKFSTRYSKLPNLRSKIYQKSAFDWWL